MPYIEQSLRDQVDTWIDPLEIEILKNESNPGRLNYVISRLVSARIRNQCRYFRINEAIGVLECCKLELYRRLAAEYEDKKCVENGDVF